MNSVIRIDPFTNLPAELKLEILDLVPLTTVASMTAVSRFWHNFIHEVNQDRVFIAHNKTWHPEGTRDFSFLFQKELFSDYFTKVSRWKDLSKRQILLDKNWRSESPAVSGTVIKVGHGLVKRFQPDFIRRFILTTWRSGGLKVTDMDTGNHLWGLPPTVVMRDALLQYEDGVAIWIGNDDNTRLEVWRTGLPGSTRGKFRQVATLKHPHAIRGFRLSHSTLCVVTVGQYKGFVYDMATDEPRKLAVLDIGPDMEGHVDQNSGYVLLSTRAEGYQVFDKSTGTSVGFIEPKKCSNVFQIEHPGRLSDTFNPDITSTHAPDGFAQRSSAPCSPPATIVVRHGPLPRQGEVPRNLFKEEVWGTCVLSDNLMVGMSSHSRLFVCRDLEGFLNNWRDQYRDCAVIECEDQDSRADRSGWLAFRDNRILFRVKNCVYVVALTEDGGVVGGAQHLKRGSYALPLGDKPSGCDLSSMGLCEDGLMTTFHMGPVSMIRVTSLAPRL